MILGDDDVQAIANAVIEKQQRYASPVLNTDEAMKLVGKDSEGAFRRWRKLWNVPMCDNGRYSRRALEVGLTKESRQKRKHANNKKD